VRAPFLPSTNQFKVQLSNACFSLRSCHALKLHISLFCARVGLVGVLSEARHSMLGPVQLSCLHVISNPLATSQSGQGGSIIYLLRYLPIPQGVVVWRCYLSIIASSLQGARCKSMENLQLTDSLSHSRTLHSTTDLQRESKCVGRIRPPSPIHNVSISATHPDSAPSALLPRLLIRQLSASTTIPRLPLAALIPTEP
jgi:hypothetical protein